MSLPKKVKIGHLTYTTKELPLPSPMETPHQGIILFREQEIHLDPGQSSEALRECLLHEIVHAVLLETGFHDENNDDRLVRAISQGLFQVLTENPAAAVFIIEGR